MIELSLCQYSRQLFETMHISRGGFTSRTHNIIKLTYKGKSFFSEIIGDSELIKYLINRLFNSLKNKNNFSNLNDFFEGVEKWINSFVYLESHSSVNSIACAFRSVNAQTITNTIAKTI